MNRPHDTPVPWRTPALTSRLPRTGETIFSVMSALAQEHGAVNLGQGFPDFDCDARLVDAVTAAMRHQASAGYPPSSWPEPRQATSSSTAAVP